MTTDAHTGTNAVTISMSEYVDGTARLMPTFDLGECAPTVTAGKSYDLSAWYKSDVVTQFDLYYRTALGTWAYWTSSPWFAASPDVYAKRSPTRRRPCRPARRRSASA